MLQPGMILQNRYQILQPLGQGGMGAVYLARDMRLGNILVAVKENSGGDARQFEQEAILLAQLRHPNLPRVQDHFLLPNGAQYLVMEYVEGTDLDSQLQNGALPESKVRAWFIQILDAVGYLHSRGVIHRDIKPANIRITPTGQAMLVDFGIAKIMQGGQKTLTGAKAVTPGFAAPEQYRGGTDARSDIYSLGATLYALLTGSVPPDAQSLERGSATLTKPRALNRAISANAEQVIMQAMNVNSVARFADAGAMSQALHTSATIPASVASGNRATFPTRYVILGGLGAAVLGVCILSSLLVNSILNPTAAPTTILPTRAAIATFTPRPNPTATVLPTNTQPPAPPPTVKPTTAPTVIPTNLPTAETPTDVPSSGVVTGRALENLNIRAQPSTSASLLGKIPKDTLLMLLARTSNSDWYQIVLPNNANERGWVAAQFVAITAGEVSALAVDSSTNFSPTTVAQQQNQTVDDIPGVKIIPGNPVSGLLDDKTHPVDVYSFDLTRGQSFSFKVSASNGCGSVYLFYPDARSIRDSNARLDSYGCYDGQTGDFTVATDGTFYITISASSSGQPYTLSTQVSNLDIQLGEHIDDIRGIKITSGNSVSGLLDAKTHPVDVYSFDLMRGQSFSFKVSASNGCGSVYLFYPDARSIRDSNARLDSYGCYDGQAGDFTVPATGTYYLAIIANGIGQPYALSTRAVMLGAQPIDGVPDIPGIKLNPGDSVNGLLDQKTHSVDVYSFDLANGQIFTFKVSASNGCGSIYLFGSDARSIRDSNTRLDSYGCYDGQAGDFTVPATGTYYLAITASGIGQPYVLSIRAR